VLLLTALFACREVPSEGELSVLTYNVQGLPDPLTDYTLPLVERMDRIAPRLVDDLIGLQEDFDAEAHERLVAAASHPERPWFEARVDENRAYGAGLGLLAPSNAGYAEQHYTACNGVLDGSSDCLASKGFQVLTVELADGLLLDVMNTHHEAGGGPDDVTARAAQVDEILASIDGRSAGRAVLFMGDTNLRPSDPDDGPLLERYAAAGLRDACVELDCAEPDHIDRFLFRDGDDLALQVLDWENLEPEFVDEDGDPLSDHPPLRVRLAWTAL
jgi:endonuclease/exonuclease/phosphatase family metal-dependent hydrolase